MERVGEAALPFHLLLYHKVGDSIVYHILAILKKIISHKIDFATIKINPKFMQSGHTVVMIQQSGTFGGVAEVTFSTPFNNVPNVVLTTQYATGFLASATINTVDNTKFGIVLRGDTVGTTSQRDVYWIAIDPTQPPLIAA